MATQMELEVFGAKSGSHPDFQREKAPMKFSLFSTKF